MLKVKYLLIFLITICASCNRSQSHYSSQERDEPQYQSKDEDDASDNEEENGCGIEDGTYSATVDYDNPNTGYSATYDLNVEVSDCEVVQIDFNNGGYLDEDHISPAEIDKDGNAYVEGEDGKTYNVHIEN